MSNKITIALASSGRTIQARLQPRFVTPDAPQLLYWRGRKLGGHVTAADEGITWLRGWNHDKKTRDALVVAAALGRV